ncbi:hypothetical protein [Flammeovirga sp. SJP92]|uniref:hypothetical protein n=1 Tax=Flammeovirga sp. SJP92 TaxID=1775430 RepID=UPI0007894EDF|nr:hypothetical protein [Flammeovirga sp. SJP92]KXX71011.1 hypothetical protein AVL50_10440 [Flammeovirga sp. SJP92]
MSLTKKFIGTLLLAASFSVASFASDNPIKEKNNIRKNYKTSTVTTGNIQTNDDIKVTAKKRKGAYHVQNKAGVNTLAEANKVEAGKQLERGTNGVYPYQKWAK